MSLWDYSRDGKLDVISQQQRTGESYGALSDFKIDVKLSKPGARMTRAPLRFLPSPWIDRNRYVKCRKGNKI